MLAAAYLLWLTLLAAAVAVAIARWLHDSRRGVWSLLGAALAWGGVGAAALAREPGGTQAPMLWVFLFVAAFGLGLFVLGCLPTKRKRRKPELSLT